MSASSAVQARRSRYAGLGVLAVIAAILATNGVWIARHWDALRPIEPGDVAPQFELHTLDRSGTVLPETVALRDLRGDVVLIDFWAEWCKPCRQSIPMLERAYQRFGSKGFHVLSVKTDGPDLGRATELIRATSFPVVVDDGYASEAYTVTTIPHMVLVDHLGVVRYVHRGGAGEARLVEQIERLLDRRALR